MVYCQACGTQNADTNQVCTNCGVALYSEAPSHHKEDECFGERDKAQDECFGVPGGGSIFGMLMGVIVIIFALAWAFGFDISIFWSQYLGPIVAGFIGLMIVVGSIIGLSRARRR